MGTSIDRSERRTAASELRTLREWRTRKKRWSVWSGSIDDFRQVLEVLAAQHESEGDSTMVITVQRTPNDTSDLLGPIEELVDYVSRTKAAFLKICLPGPQSAERRVEFALGRDGVLVDGIELSISSSDPRWLSAAYEQICDAVDNGVPWWAPARSYVALTTFFLACALISIAAALGGLTAQWGFADWIGYIAVVGVGLATPAVFAAWLLRRYVPPFEIVKAGRKSRGAALLAALATSASSVGIGMLVNWIS